MKKTKFKKFDLVSIIDGKLIFSDKIYLKVADKMKLRNWLQSSSGSNFTNACGIIVAIGSYPKRENFYGTLYGVRTRFGDVIVEESNLNMIASNIIHPTTKR